MKKSLFFLVFLSGCMVGPDYRPPEMFVPEEWHAPEANIACPDDAWWQTFDDALLNKYIGLAAQNNNDLLKAEANICQARGQLNVTASDWYPHISADLDVLRTYLSKNGPIDFIESNNSLPTRLKPRVPSAFNLYNMLIDASWEIDFFGKIGRSVEASQATLQSIVEQRNALLISVFAEVAMNYIQVRSAQERIQLIQENIDLLEQNAEVVRAQFKAGYSRKLDVESIEAELEVSRAALPDIYAQLFQNIYSLSVLTGELPETFVGELLVPKPLPTPPMTVAVGLRSDLLRRRPDILEAERQLAAATANIGVAVASFFPSVTLLGFSGLQSLHLNKLFQGHSATWALLGDVNIPIFQGGKLCGNLKANQAQACAALANYQGVVLKAIQEAESALMSYEQELKTQNELQKATDHFNDVYAITNEQFRKGLVPITDSIYAERQLISTQLNLLDSRTTALVDLIALYKAVAGPLIPCE